MNGAAVAGHGNGRAFAMQYIVKAAEAALKATEAYASGHNATPWWPKAAGIAGDLTACSPPATSLYRNASSIAETAAG